VEIADVQESLPVAARHRVQIGDIDEPVPGGLID
jgi:hypothetical protein